jgi:hypothetical protein
MDPMAEDRDANPPLHHPEPIDRLQILAVVGMQSSGTSVAAGMLQEQGVELGDAHEERTWQQVKGFRENLRLTRLAHDVLAHSGGSWRDPPTGPLRYTAEHVARRNEILASYRQPPCAFKDTSTLLVLDFWRDVPLHFIGVIRNPVSVASSLARRTRRARRNLRRRLFYLRRGLPALSFNDSLRLWKIYNLRLLDQLRQQEFPVINFDDKARLGDQVRSALGFHGIPAPNRFSFFEPDAVKHDTDEWRAQLEDREALDLWDQLVAFTVPRQGRAVGSPR